MEYIFLGANEDKVILDIANALVTNTDLEGFYLIDTTLRRKEDLRGILEDIL